MKRPVADLHCDLLTYLRNPKHSAYDPQVRASIPQLRAGNVQTQVMAIYVPSGKGSSIWASEQYEVYKKLPEKYPEAFSFVKEPGRIHVKLAIENACGIAEESDPLDKAFVAIEKMTEDGHKICYISLTWNTENRFGGGNFTQVGLKEDGKRLLEYLHGKGIAVDFSHTSDRLAEDILNYIDKKSLDLNVIASHSNMRAVFDVPRNLPDAIAKEIFSRGGIVGLNFIKSFIGEHSPSDMAKHLEHVVKLGGEKQVCFGADFFYLGDIPAEFRKSDDAYFFDELADASTYSTALELFKSGLQASDEFLDAISHANFHRYMR